MDEQNTPKSASFDLDVNIQPAQTEPENPLNTGNGDLNNEINTPNMTAPSPAEQTTNPAPQQEIHEIKLDNLSSEVAANAEISATNQATEVTNQPTESTTFPMQETPQIQAATNSYTSSDNKIFKFKKYIIIAAVSILALAITTILYKVLATGDTATTDSQNNSLTNSLSSSENQQNTSEEMQKLDSVVNDLKDVYDTGESTSNPPSLVIDLSEESATDLETNPEQPAKKISR